MGASPASRTFYLQVKGELEQAILALGFPSITVVRPSLLLGDRAEFRLGEMIAARLAWAFPRKYRAVHVRDVARALVDAAVEDRPGVRGIENPEIDA
ncbi:MAG: Rossmann-fold NAD(P)-binding domain-containing protein [Gemmatimonadales bacterium]